MRSGSLVSAFKKAVGFLPLLTVFATSCMKKLPEPVDPPCPSCVVTAPLNKKAPVTQSGWKQKQTEMMRDTAQRREFRAFLKQLDPFKKKPLIEKLSAIDSLVDNTIKYEYDSIVYKMHEYWAPAYETLKNKRGDCDDLAIIKYEAGKYLGVDDRISYLAQVGPKDSVNYSSLNHLTWVVDTSQGRKKHNMIFFDSHEGYKGKTFAESKYRLWTIENKTVPRQLIKKP